MAEGELVRGLRRRVPITRLETELDELLDDSDDDIDVGDVGNEFDSDYQETDADATEESDQEVGTEDEVRPRVNGTSRNGDRTDSEWTRYLRSDDDFATLPFTVRSPGIQPIHPRPQTELEFFQLFFTNELLAAIVAETNRYAREKIQRNMPLRKSSLWNNWVDVNLEEMKAVLGVIMNMALNDKSKIEDYFSQDWLDYQPFFKDVFSRNRFCQVFWMLHLNPPATQANQGMSSRGQKVQNVTEYIDRKCREHFIPGQKIAVDESTVGYKGRIIFKCYNPNKPTKWGMRVFSLCDSATGYMCVFVPYFGSPTTNSLVRPDLPFTSRIVLQLCDKLLQTTNGTGYHVYTDRFYTSYTLAIELLQKEIHLTGTVMSNRKGLPKEIKKPSIGLHEVIAFRKDNKVLVLAWKDKRVVQMLSTVHNANTEIIERIRRRGIVEEINKPKVIIDYTANMGAVDRADHYCGSYSFTRKTMKWWRKMFFWVLEVSIVNSFILMNISKQKQGLPTMSHIGYRRKLILQLVGNVRNKNSKKRGRPSTIDKEERLNNKPHFITKSENNNKKKDCKVCSDRKNPGGRKETVWFCETCSRQPGLHPGTCFKSYHTKEKYREL